MNNLDFWQQFVGEDSPEDFLRTYGSIDPELCVARFLEDRGNLYGVVNQGSWAATFEAPEQHHLHTVRMYLLSYLDETRDTWAPALEAKPPSIPRRYREKFDQDKYPPPPTVDDMAGDEDGAPPTDNEADSGAEAPASETSPEASEHVAPEVEAEAETVEADEAVPEPETAEAEAETEADETVEEPETAEAADAVAEPESAEADEVQPEPETVDVDTGDAAPDAATDESTPEQPAPGSTPEEGDVRTSDG